MIPTFEGNRKEFTIELKLSVSWTTKAEYRLVVKVETICLSVSEMSHL
jgi:hypothetical protein